MKSVKFSFIALLILAGWPLALLAQQKQPTEKEALLVVSVINEKKKPQPGEQVTFVGEKSKKTFSGVTGPDGLFEVLVPKGDKYAIKYKTLSSQEDYTTLDIPDVKGELLTFDVIIQFEVPKTYTLENVYFETGKSTIKPESFKYIDEMAEYLKLKKTMVIEISGHTDNVGSAEANLKLSQDRAAAVRTYLVKKGIAGERIQAKGYGDTQPIAPNETEQGRQKNRRTEVRILSE